MREATKGVEFKQYQRTQVAEMADWHEGFDMSGVSVSEPDRQNGSPKEGDKIARNPANHADKWLVAAAYFAANFAPIESSARRFEGYVVEREVLYGQKQGQRLIMEAGGLPAVMSMDTAIEVAEYQAAGNPRILPATIHVGDEEVKK